jgi:hypothetical protein
MRTELTRAVLGLCCVLTAAVPCGGCAPGVRAPDGWLPRAEQAQRDPYGGWIAVIAGRGPGDLPPAVPASPLIKKGKMFEVSGELLAVDQDSLYVLTADAVVCAVSLAAITRAKATAYDPRVGPVRRWAALGTVSAVGQGAGMLLTLPLWLIVGLPAASAHGAKAHIVLRADGGQFPRGGKCRPDWAALRPYARFPQGPPPELRSLGLWTRRAEQLHAPAEAPREKPQATEPPPERLPPRQHHWQR